MKWQKIFINAVILNLFLVGISFVICSICNDDLSLLRNKDLAKVTAGDGCVSSNCYPYCQKSCYNHGDGYREQDAVKVVVPVCSSSELGCGCNFYGDLVKCYDVKDFCTNDTCTSGCQTSGNYVRVQCSTLW
jgi:hypothetical protein